MCFYCVTLKKAPKKNTQSLLKMNELDFWFLMHFHGKECCSKSYQRQKKLPYVPSKLFSHYTQTYKVRFVIIDMYIAIWGKKPDFRNCMRKQNLNWESFQNGPFFILHTSLETTEWKVAFDEKIFSWLFCWHAIKLRWCSDALQCIMLWS